MIKKCRADFLITNISMVIIIILEQDEDGIAKRSALLKMIKAFVRIKMRRDLELIMARS